MKSKSNSNYIKATIIGIIVAFLISMLILGMAYIALKDKIELATTTLSIISVNTSNEENVINIKEIDGQKLITTYPSYGQKYAKMNIESCNISLPVYFGDTLDILTKGVGHNSGSYFPGEGGSIVYLAHNTKNFLYNVKDISIGDKIQIDADYGKFVYEVYETSIINETDLHKLPIQKEEEILMIYTCYPFGYMGYATKRMVIYSKLVSYEFAK